MTQENYELLLWLLGDRVFHFNLACLSGILAWAAVSYGWEAIARLRAYFEYKWDTDFWADVLAE